MEKRITKALAAAATAALTVFGAHAEWGTENCPGILLGKTQTRDVKTAQTADGATYAVWTSGSAQGYSLHAQFMDADGNLMWGDEGVLVDGHATAGWYSYWNIAVTPEGELVVSWADARSEEGAAPERYEAQVPVLYKLDKAGKMLWGDEGVVLDGERYRFPAQLFQVGGNLYAKCYGSDEQNPTQLFLLDEFGESAWDSGKDFGGQLIASEGDDFIAVYGNSDGVVAMRYDKDMNRRWKEPSLISEKRYLGYDRNPYTLRGDGSGGVAVCYQTALGSFAHIPLVAYVTSGGETAFAEDAPDTDMYDHLYPVMNINPSTEEIMTVWQMDASRKGLQAQLMDFYGERLWGPMGETFVSKDSPAGWSYGSVAVEPLEGGDWLVCWADELGWADNQLWLGRFGRDGKAVWAKEIGEHNAVYDPKLAMRGRTVDITWCEDESYVDDDGQDQNYRVLRGVRIGDVYDLAGIAAAEAGPAGGEEEYWSVQGVRLAAPAKGLNIVRKADGTAKKVLVK